MNWRLTLGFIFLAILLAVTFYIAVKQTPAIRVLPGDEEDKNHYEGPEPSFNPYESNELMDQVGPFGYKIQEREMIDASGNRIFVQFSAF